MVKNSQTERAPILWMEKSTCLKLWRSICNRCVAKRWTVVSNEKQPVLWGVQQWEGLTRSSTNVSHWTMEGVWKWTSSTTEPCVVYCALCVVCLSAVKSCMSKDFLLFFFLVKFPFLSSKRLLKYLKWCKDSVRFVSEEASGRLTQYPETQIPFTQTHYHHPKSDKTQQPCQKERQHRMGCSPF